MTNAALDTPAFQWLRDLLWPASGPQAGGRRYAVLSRGDRPRLVVPLESRAALREALRRTSADVSTIEALARRVAGVGASLGLVTPLLRTRFRAGTPDDAEPLETYLAAAVGLPRIELAATIGPPRPNRKPVLQLIDPGAGITVGFAKVGWNGLTRALVRREADILEQLATTATARIVTPEVLHVGSWRDLDISVLSPLDPPHRSASRRDPTTAELLELAAMGERTRGPLAGSPYEARLRARIEALDPSDPAVGDRRERYGAVLGGIVAGAGDHVLEYGRSHGDWTPWNMAPLADRLLVWDWERSDTGVPVLVDAVHYEFQRAWLRQSREPAAALHTAVVACGNHAEALGVDASTVEVIADLYLLELNLRYTENAAAGTDELRSGRHAAVEQVMLARY